MTSIDHAAMLVGRGEDSGMDHAELEHHPRHRAGLRRDSGGFGGTGRLWARQSDRNRRQHGRPLGAPPDGRGAEAPRAPVDRGRFHRTCGLRADPLAGYVIVCYTAREALSIFRSSGGSS